MSAFEQISISPHQNFLGQFKQNIEHKNVGNTLCHISTLFEIVIVLLKKVIKTIFFCKQMRQACYLEFANSLFGKRLVALLDSFKTDNPIFENF